MSHLKDLENITPSEKEKLKELLLSRIRELEETKEQYESRLDSDCFSVRAKIMELKKLIKFNAYLYHWVCDPATHYLQ